MPQAVSRWSVTEEDRVYSQASVRDICGGLVTLGKGFLPLLWFPPISIIPPTLCTHSLTYSRCCIILAFSAMLSSIIKLYNLALKKSTFSCAMCLCAEPGNRAV